MCASQCPSFLSTWERRVPWVLVPLCEILEEALLRKRRHFLPLTKGVCRFSCSFCTLCAWGVDECNRSLKVLGNGVFSTNFSNVFGVGSTFSFLSLIQVLSHLTSWKAASLTMASLPVSRFMRSQALWSPLIPTNKSHSPVRDYLWSLINLGTRHTTMQSRVWTPPSFAFLPLRASYVSTFFKKYTCRWSTDPPLCVLYCKLPITPTRLGCDSHRPGFFFQGPV